MSSANEKQEQSLFDEQVLRSISAKAFVNLDMQSNTWQSGSTYANRYYNAFTYDANGNILTQSRYAENGTQIENLTYQYNRNTSGKMIQNRLYHVNETGSCIKIAPDSLFKAKTNTTIENSWEFRGAEGAFRN